MTFLDSGGSKEYLCLKRNSILKKSLTSRGASNLVLDYVDFVDQSKLFEHCENLAFRHVLRHLTNEQLHALVARRFLLHFSLRHWLRFFLYFFSLPERVFNCFFWEGEVVRLGKWGFLNFKIGSSKDLLELKWVQSGATVWVYLPYCPYICASYGLWSGCTYTVVRWKRIWTLRMRLVFLI